MFNERFYISSGRLNKLYTLRHAFKETMYSRNGSYVVDRDHHVASLSNDWETAVSKATAMVGPDAKFYVGEKFELGVITHRSPEDVLAERVSEAKFFNITAFERNRDRWIKSPWKFDGKTIPEFAKTDPEKLLWFVENKDSLSHHAKRFAEFAEFYLETNELVMPDKEECPNGTRATIEGTIVNVNTKENDFGVRYVMTVKDDRGFNVWGTIPRSLDGSLDEMKGKRVKFDAALTRSDTDDYFGFFKRPTKASYLDG